MPAFSRAGAGRRRNLAFSSILQRWLRTIQSADRILRAYDKAGLVVPVRQVHKGGVMSFIRRAAVMLVTALTAVPLLAMAQEPVRDFAQLNTRLRPGDTVWVTDAQGREVKGSILSLAADALTLEGRARTFGAPDVRSIQVRRADSLGNGALIGLGVGGGLALTACLIAASDDDGNKAGCAAAALFYAGIGSGIGVGIDALIPGKKLVAYRAPGSTAQPHARLSIAPLVTPRAKGAVLSFAF